MNLREHIELVMALLGMALLATACDGTFASQTTTPEGSPAVAPLAQNASNQKFTSIATATAQANTTRRNPDCLTGIKANEVFGMKLSDLFNPFAGAGNGTCANIQVPLDSPVAYPPTPQSQFEQTSKTIKRRYPAST